MPEDDTKSSESRLAELEAKAVAEATASADDSFKPSPSLLNAPSPDALMQQVDGPSLEGYHGKESVYVGKSVPVAMRARLEVPINVSAPGSVVEYAVESKAYDVGFGVTAEREEGITIVKVCVFFLMMFGMLAYESLICLTERRSRIASSLISAQ